MGVPQSGTRRYVKERGVDHALRGYTPSHFTTGMRFSVRKNRSEYFTRGQDVNFTNWHELTQFIKKMGFG